jgi:rod shape-determining protein MreC
LLFAVLFSCLLMIADNRFKQLSGLRYLLTTVTHPIHMIAEGPAAVTNWIGEQFSSRSTLQSENRQFRQENLRLQGEMLRFRSLEEENSRLRLQLGATLKLGERVTLAELVGINLTPYRQQVTLSKGSMSSVYQGQVVINASGIMGQVIQVTPFRSTVLLITDSLHSTPVRIHGSGVLTIAHGTGHIDKLELPYLPDSANVKVGDLLVTSGLGNRFPPDYPVALITEVPAPGTSGTVVATPMANLSQNRQVMLVWNIDSALELPTAETAAESLVTPDEAPSGGTPPATQAKPGNNGEHDG